MSSVSLGLLLVHFIYTVRISSRVLYYNICTVGWVECRNWSVEPESFLEPIFITDVSITEHQFKTPIIENITKCHITE